MINNIRMQCRICDETFYYSEEQIKKDYPTHCGKIGLVPDYHDLDLAQLALQKAFNSEIPIKLPSEL